MAFIIPVISLLQQWFDVSPEYAATHVAVSSHVCVSPVSVIIFLKVNMVKTSLMAITAVSRTGRVFAISDYAGQGFPHGRYW